MLQAYYKCPWPSIFGTINTAFPFLLNIRPPKKTSVTFLVALQPMKMATVFAFIQLKAGIILPFAKLISPPLKKCAAHICLPFSTSPRLRSRKVTLPLAHTNAINHMNAWPGNKSMTAWCKCANGCWRKASAANRSSKQSKKRPQLM